MEGESNDRAAILRPYLPRLAIEWLAEHGDAPYREIDGTLAFVDISGFTKLSERLSRRGKVGAEELTDTIGACFTELLAVAYERGGSLIKFGGDALLILFRGDDHAVRACGAALGMRAALRRIGDVVTPGGRVRLRMSVGVHTGTFHFFLVGHDHRELIVTGPAATQTTLMEQTADAGQIVISPETAAALPARSLGAKKGAGVLLRNAPEAADPGIDPILEGFDPASCIPVAIREHLLGGGGEPEHRQACVLFMRFEGSDEVLAAEGPAALAERLGALVATVQKAAAARGVTFLGSDIDRNGGKIILAAGAPRTTGADDEATLLTARDVIEAAPPLSLRLGVNRGYVFAGDIGPHYRRTYTVMGDTVNLAARLMASAEPGSVYAANDVLERSRTAFATSPLEPFLVKGKSQPVQASVVGPAQAAAAAAAETGSRFIGRHTEVALLLDALEQARARRGKVVELIGEPGMGASRLVEEVRNRASGLKIVTTNGGPHAASTPYFPFRSFFRELLGIRSAIASASAGRSLRDRVAADAPDMLPWLPLLGAVIDIPVEATPQTLALDEEYRRAQLERVTADFLGLIQPTPALLVFEDVHYFDEASAGLLRGLIASSAERPWLILLTRRAGRGSRFVTDQPHARTVGLAPLDDERAAEFVIAATEDAPPSEHELATLVERAGGNPLFLRELINAWRSAGSVEHLPDSVETLMAARIDNLPPSDRDVLRSAAVLGTAFDGALLPAVLSDDAAADDRVWRRLSEFIRRDARGWYRFTNVLIRDAAYEQLTYRRRAALHAAVGDWILARGRGIEEQTELLALHFFHAQRWEDTWRFARRAGELAKSKYANVEAARFFAQALEAAKRLSGRDATEQANCAESLGDVLRVGSEFHKAEDAYRTARRLLKGTSSVRQAQILLKQAQIADRVGRLPDALRWIKRGMSAVEEAEGPDAGKTRAQLFAWYGAIKLGQSRYVEAARWSERAIVEARATGELRALAQAYVTLDLIDVNQGHASDHSYSQQALEIYEQLGDLSRQSVVLNNLGAFAYYEGRWDEAVTMYERARLSREQTGDPVGAAIGTANVGEIRADQGHLAEAEPILRYVLRVCRGAGDRSSAAFVLGVLARVEARSGRLEEGLAALREAREEYNAIGEFGGALEVDARIAEALVLRGDPRAGIRAAREVLAAAGDGDEVGVYVPMLRRVLGLGSMRVGELR
ncbi:MAG TPA: adenylate/guanylate cyclase domain-containing protein, partial [Actinomycetota bacterium]|nr:adenylate/guanylate cyclase domain-containing protein [Actinomycetota bacterium]